MYGSRDTRGSIRTARDPISYKALKLLVALEAGLLDRVYQTSSISRNDGNPFLTRSTASPRMKPRTKNGPQVEIVNHISADVPGMHSSEEQRCNR
jgi:hypothetical protein